MAEIFFNNNEGHSQSYVSEVLTSDFSKSLEDDFKSFYTNSINIDNVLDKCTDNLINNFKYFYKNIKNWRNEKFAIIYIDENNRAYWLTKTNEYLFPSQNKSKQTKEHIYIFLWFSGKTKIEESKKVKKHLEFTEKEFGYSRLLRDAVKKDNRGFEIDLSLNEDLFKNELQRKIDKLNNKEKTETDYNDVFNKIWETKESYFDYSLVADKENFKALLIDFYAYGLNKNALEDILTSTSEEYKKYFAKWLNFNELKIGHELAGLGLEIIKKGYKNELDINQELRRLGCKVNDINFNQSLKNNELEIGYELVAIGLELTKENVQLNINERLAKLGVIVENNNNKRIEYELIELGLELIKKDEKNFYKLPKKRLGNLVNWYFRINILSDLVKLLINYKTPSKELNILLIDDHPGKVKLELDRVKDWFTLAEGHDKKCKLKIKNHKPDLQKNIIDDLKSFADDKFNTFDFILVDLDYDGEPKGFEYIQYFRSIKSVYDKPYVVVFSRNEEAASIQKALNMGALFFASKQNFAHLLLELFKVMSLKEPDKKHKFSLGANWSLLYQLPLTKILSLKKTVLKAEDCFEKKSDDKAPDFFKFSKDLLNNKDYKWIKKLPKAELHNHIGSVLGSELIPQTALLVLSQFYGENESNFDKGRIEEILKFIEPIVSDPFLFELVEEKEDYTNNENEAKKFINTKSTWYKLKKLFIVNEETQYFHQSIFNIAADTLNLKANMDNPEEVLLSPENEIIEKRYHPLSAIKNSDYFEAKLQLRKTGVKYDEVMLFFILLLEIRNKITFHKNEGKSPRDILYSIKEKIKSKVNEVNNEEIFDSKVIDQIKDFADKLVALGNKENLLIDFYSDENECNKECSILKFLISANSPQRCLPYENRGLFNYLRGCEYGGAPHLQSKESMFLAAEHIVNNYALEDNIRYLDLRCAIDGYTKFKLIDNEDKATEYLENAFGYWQKKAWDDGKGKKVHVNIIITAKRHKSIKEFEKNVDLTIRHFNKKSNNDEKFWESPCKVVSFDIAGIEKGNRVSKFKKELRPLLLKCIPTTIHAGEEDTEEAIWEAVYEAHVSRIGHGLTLKDNQDLLNLVRETHVNVELCPVSNFLTNNKFSLKEDNKYPLRKYLKNRVSVSINTDDPYVSDTDLTKEFLFAVKLSGGLTKWQILKIILYSFKSITISKKEKSKLLKEINEEIFELLLNEEEK